MAPLAHSVGCPLVARLPAGEAEEAEAEKREEGALPQEKGNGVRTLALAAHPRGLSIACSMPTSTGAASK